MLHPSRLGSHTAHPVIPMYIKDFEIENIRGFQGAHHASLTHHDGTHAGWTVIAGRNGSGKSTLLRALALATIGPWQAPALVGVFESWVNYGADTGSIKATLLPHECDTYENSKHYPLEIPLETIWKKDHSNNNISTIDINSLIRLKNFQSIAGPWHEKQDQPNIWPHKNKGWFLASYGPYRHLGVMPQEISRLSLDPTLARVLNLFYETSTLSGAVDWLISLHFKSLEGDAQSKELLNKLKPFISDGLLPEHSSIEKITSEDVWIKHPKRHTIVGLSQNSDGYRTVLAIVADILRRLYECYGRLDIESVEGRLVCTMPGVVLIDEVDAHMHVSWQQKIGPWLTEHFPNIQFIVSTHSPFICQAAKSILRLPTPSEGGEIERLDERTLKTIRFGTIDDAVLSSLFGLEHAHSPASEAVRREVAHLESKILRQKATQEEIDTYKTYKASLPDTLGDVAKQRARAIMNTEE